MRKAAHSCFSPKPKTGSRMLFVWVGLRANRPAPSDKHSLMKGVATSALHLCAKEGGLIGGLEAFCFCFQ